MDKVYIAKVKNENIKEAVSFCLERIIEEKIKTADTVLIKPNFLGSRPAHTGVTTDLRVISAIIEILQEKGINKIFLAEASFADTEKIFRNLGVYNLENYGIKVINLEKSEKVTTEFPSASVLKKMVLPRPVVETDVIINVPKLKTHAQTRVSLGIKNLFGFLYTPQRKIAHSVDLDKAIIDIYIYLKTILGKKMISLVDAIYCLEGKLGPNIGKAVKMDLLVGGADLPSVDATCVRIMGSEPRSVRHLLLCEQTGLGKQQIIGEPINRIRKRFSLPGVSATLFPQLNTAKETIFKKYPIIRYPDRCTACGICAEACPKNCIKLNNTCQRHCEEPRKVPSEARGRGDEAISTGLLRPYGVRNDRMVSGSAIPIIDYTECIGCLCCVEGCPNKVFRYKVRNHLLFILLQKLYRLAKWIIKQE